MAADRVRLDLASITTVPEHLLASELATSTTQTGPEEQPNQRKQPPELL